MSEIEAVKAETPETVEIAKPERTFAADDVERIVKERLARERSKYADYDELKDKASKYEQVKAEQMSEVERAKEDAKASADRALALEAELNSVKKLTDQRKLLVEMGFDPTAVENLAGRLSGDDVDAWKEDAEKFLPYMKTGGKAPHAAANDLDSPKEDPMISAFKRGAGLTA